MSTNEAKSKLEGLIAEAMEGAKGCVITVGEILQTKSKMHYFPVFVKTDKTGNIHEFKARVSIRRHICSVYRKTPPKWSHINTFSMIEILSQNKELMKELPADPFPTPPELMRDLPRSSSKMKSLKKQVGGDHYQQMNIQPMEYFAANQSHERIIGAVIYNVNKYINRSKEAAKIDIDWQKAIQVIQWGLEAIFGKIPDESDMIPSQSNFDKWADDLLSHAPFIRETKTVPVQAQATMPMYPKTKYADTNTLKDQIQHMRSEAMEFLDASDIWLSEGDGDNKQHLHKMLDESTDFVHSRETYKHISGQARASMAMSDIRVIEKNKKRGYYKTEKAIIKNHTGGSFERSE